MTTHAAIKNTFGEDFSVQKYLTIIVYSVEKIWRKKYCNGEYFLIPALRFYTKVYSENGIKSIPELAEDNVKETFLTPVYELVYSEICQ